MQLRSVKKKKTKRNKSKKIRRLKDYSDESESAGSDSSLYSSSDDDYRRQKRRSKASKKRSRKRYSSSESDDDHDDDTRLLKKKKRSKRKDEHVGKKKKKIGSRKRRKRDASSSSTSGDSLSIRDSQSDDGSESDGKRRSKDRGRLGKVKAVRRRSKDESEEDSEPDECWQVEDEVMTEKKSRRLKSIIVVSYSYDNDERKEDMVDDHGVYLRHGGNNDSGNREFGHNEESDSDNDESGEDNKSETSKASHQDNSLKDDDLEAILKKRALENLKRFRGETQRSEIARKEVSSAAEGEPLQIESEKSEESQDHGLMEQKKLCVSADSRDFEDSQKILHGVDNVKESETVFPDIASQQDQQSGDTVMLKVSSGISSCSSKRRLIRPVLGQESLNLASRKEAAGSEDAEAESINGSTIDKNCPESSLALATKNGGENIEPTKVSSTLNAQSSSRVDTETLDGIRGESQSEQKTTDETKDESQYEQKTMTVMRGGEMVQVKFLQCLQY